jgi:hypothetical protein
VAGSTFTLDGSVGVGTYSAGGFVNGGALGQISVLLQNTVVPDTATETVISATAFNVGLAAIVTLPAAYATRYRAAVIAAWTAYVNAQPIGGTDGVLDKGDAIGVLYSAGAFSGQPSVVLHIPSASVALSGGSLDSNGNLIFPSPQSVAIPFPAFAPTLNGV